MIIYIPPYKFTNFFYYQNEFEILKKKTKIKIEIHDLSYILNKDNNKYFLKSYKDKVKVLKFHSISSWKSHMESLIKKNNKVKVFNYIYNETLSSILINYYLYKKGIDIIKIFTPGGFDIDYDTKNSITLTKIFENFYKFRKIFYFFKKKFFGFLLRQIKFKYNTVLYNGSKKINPFHLSTDKYKSFHSFDYSKYLINKKKNNENNKKKGGFIIFLNSAFPSLKADYYIFGESSKIDIKKWFYELNYFLNF